MCVFPKPTARLKLVHAEEVLLMRWLLRRAGSLKQCVVSLLAGKSVTSNSAAELPIAPWMRRQVLSEIVERCFEHSGIDYRAFNNGSVIYLAIKEGELALASKTLANLEDFSGLAGLVLRTGSGGSYRKTVPVSAIRFSDLETAASFRLELPYRLARFKTDKSGSVEVLVLEQRDKRLVSKRKTALKIDWTVEFGGAEAKKVTPSNTPRLHVLESEPVDIVYTWVDSSDPEWQAERDYWASRQGTDMESANNDERYLDRDELRYSLRSVWLYAPFVRNIYIVTTGHVPAWLKRQASNIQIVEHGQIFPDTQVLPTFNSHAIEACLHRIPGLSEHFIYFNDDVFLGREVAIDTFFTKAGLIKSRFTPSTFTAAIEPGDDAIPTDWASYNAAKLIERDFGLHFDRKMKHVPMPMKRSLLLEIEEKYAEPVKETRAARFRSRGDLSIPSMFAHFYAVATHQGVEWNGDPGEYIYADTGRKDYMDKLRDMEEVNPAFMCMNVTRYPDISIEKQNKLLRKFLQERYPVASPYEQ